MPAVATELFAGRTEVLATKSRAEVPYSVDGAEDEDDVLNTVAGTAPLYYNLMLRVAIEITERVNTDTWKVIVRYETPDPGHEEEPVVPDPRFNFEIGGQSQHITESLQIEDTDGEISLETGNAIGFDGEKVNGCDILLTSYAFSETHYYTDAEAAAMRAVIADVANKTNADSFYGFDAGEVLFLGASGSKTGTDEDDPWEITFRFERRENRTDVSIGDLEVDVEGWQYLDVQYAPEEDGAVHQLVRKPIAVRVHRVYDSTEFSVLGLDGGGS